MIKIMIILLSKSEYISNVIYIYIYISFHYHQVDYISQMPFAYAKWENFNDLYFFPETVKCFCEVIFCIIYILDFISTKCKILHNTFYSSEVQIITWFSWLLYISPMHFISMKWKNVLMIYLASIEYKLLNRETRKCVYFHKLGKNELTFFSSLYIWFHFHNKENISPTSFNSTKWKNWIDFFYTLTFLFIFPGTGKYFTNPFYFHEMEKT